ncbi:MAG: pilus assembly protein PilM [Myxococcota bacterium]|jgi:type IV pilus assembly protein PilM|nr:pilus assembly protein PilM [Myxococcota bacterium]
MAQRILGLDVGSTSVKAVVLEAGLRKFEAVSFLEVPLPPPTPPPEPVDETEEPPPAVDREGDWLTRLGTALEQLRGELGPAPEVCITAVPAAQVTLRQISLPFTKQKEIDLVLGQEVEEYLPFRDLDEVVYDHVLLGQESGVSRLQVAVVRRSFLVRFVELLQQHGFDPRSIGAGGLAKAGLLRQLRPLDSPPVAVVDLGGSSTTVTIVVEGEALTWRSQLRGADALVRRLAASYQIAPAQAEALLQAQVELLPDQLPVSYHPERQRLSDLAKEALAPILRSLRQTLLAFSGLYDQDVKEILICGGLAQLPGIARYLEAALELPVRPLELGGYSPAARLQLDEAGSARCAEACALALAGLPQSRPEINFRKGTFAYQGGYQYVHGKVLAIAAVLALLVLGLGFFTFAKARDLSVQERALVADLKARTQVILGTPIADAEAAVARLRVTEKGGKREGIPSQSAYDLFHEINRVVPAEVQLDLENLDIDLDRRRAEIRGKTTSATAVEQIVEALEKIPCFSGGIEKEKNEKVGSEGKQLFVLNVKLSC